MTGLELDKDRLTDATYTRKVNIREREYDEENNEFIAGNNIYVEGCQVPDFYLLKKESIFTLATAALQEVDRQLQAEKAKTATLEAKTATLEAKTATLEAENTDLRADIELIKEHLGISTEVG